MERRDVIDYRYPAWKFIDLTDIKSELKISSKDHFSVSFHIAT